MVKVAFVGCGGAMREHRRCLSLLPDVEMAGHCDVERKQAEEAAKMWGGAVFTDPVAMYDAVKPDAVYVGVPPHAHGAIEEEAANRSIHLFVEKPVALGRAEAKRIGAAIRNTKVLTSAGYCFRYSDLVAMARRMLKGKAISLVRGCCIGGLPGAPWWRKRALSGGQLVEQTTHCIDLMRYLCGEVAEVHAFAARGAMTKVEDYDIDDSTVLVCRLKNGAVGSVVSSCVSSNGYRMELEVITPEAAFQFNGTSLRVIEAGKTTEYRSSLNMYEEENRAFIEAVQNGARGRIRSTYSRRGEDTPCGLRRERIHRIRHASQTLTPIPRRRSHIFPWEEVSLKKTI